MRGFVEKPAPIDAYLAEQRQALADTHRQRIAENTARLDAKRSKAALKLNAVRGRIGNLHTQRSQARDQLDETAASVELGDADEGALAIADAAVMAVERDLRWAEAAERGLRADI